MTERGEGRDRASVRVRTGMKGIYGTGAEVNGGYEERDEGRLAVGLGVGLGLGVG